MKVLEVKVFVGDNKKEKRLISLRVIMNLCTSIVSRN